MRRSTAVAATVFLLAPLFAAAPAHAASFTFDSLTNTYTYVGDFFNTCGFGCPGHASSDPRGADFITATLKFGAPLAANLTDDATLIPNDWTMKDHFWDTTAGTDGFSFSGHNLQPNGIPFDGVPGLVLSTDAVGNITNYIMSAAVGTGDPSDDHNFHGTVVAILNPPVFCGEECNNQGITDALTVRLGSPNDALEWDAFRLVDAVPEPATLTLTALGLSGALLRRRRSSLQ